MSEKKVKFEFEKQNKNSIRYKKIPEEGMHQLLVVFTFRSGSLEIVKTLK